jgi:hypothetical protein
MTMRTVMPACLLSVAACGPVVQEVDPDAGSSSTTGQLDPPPGSTGDATVAGDTTGGAETTGSGEADTTDFLVLVDGGPRVPMCDPFAQDCPPGKKCAFWADDGGPAWNATRCVDVARDPGQLDEPCTVEGSGVSGIDSCDVGLMCWDVDEEGNGTCAPLCSGSPEAPTCPDGWTCLVSSGAFAICGLLCDPLALDCPDGQACYPYNDAFSCGPDASGPDGVHGDPCRFINSCDPGFVCIGAAAHTDCSSGIGCCSMVCNYTDPTADDDCAALDPNQGCEPWFVEGMAPEGYEEVGVCALPW